MEESMAAAEDMRELNKQRIDERIEVGLAFLRESYDVEECVIDPLFANPNVGGRPYQVRRFDVKGVGNLLAMTAKEVEANQLSSFVLMPYFKNLPLLSSDFVYNGDKCSFS